MSMELRCIHPPEDGELSLAEILADPIVQIVMKHDGVTRRQVLCIVDSVRTKRLGARIGAWPETPSANSQRTRTISSPMNWSRQP